MHICYVTETRKYFNWNTQKQKHISANSNNNSRLRTTVWIKISENHSAVFFVVFLFFFLFLNFIEICWAFTFLGPFRVAYPLACWTWICPAFANKVDPDQLASEEANWSRSALFAIQYEQTGSRNLIGWHLEVGVAIYSAGQWLIRIKESDRLTFRSGCGSLFSRTRVN